MRGARSRRERWLPRGTLLASLRRVLVLFDGCLEGCVHRQQRAEHFSAEPVNCPGSKLIAIIADSVWHTYYTPDQIFVARDKIFDATRFTIDLHPNTANMGQRRHLAEGHALRRRHAVRHVLC